MHYVLYNLVYELIRLFCHQASESDSLKAVSVECMKCPTFQILFFQLIKCIIQAFEMHVFFLEFSVWTYFYYKTKSVKNSA